MAKRIELITKLDNFASRLAHIQGVDNLVKACGEIVEEIIDVEYFGMYLINAQTGKFEMLYAKGIIMSFQ